MKAKTISANSSKLLEQLHKRDLSFFSASDATKLFPEMSSGAMSELLRKMVNGGLLLRILGGLYSIIPYEKDSSTYFPNWHQVAGALANPNEYYIGFYSAMEIHGLITQPSLVEQIVTKKQILPKERIVKNVRFDFITFNEKHFFGFRKQWIDDFTQVYCSDLEKTFVDCLYKPNYAGGITEIVKALYKCRNQIDPKKLEEYSERFAAQVVFKRLGFICDRLAIFPELRDGLHKKITNAYAPLDPSLPKKGKTNPQWNIIDNLDMDSILTAINS
ncbi:type IV toxin-antitoxin system AbiEi family antitoxin [soil metagenome]